MNILFYILSDKEIERTKFKLQKAYCSRNFVKCPRCDLKIDKNNKQEHFEEFHTEVIFHFLKLIIQF